MIYVVLFLYIVPSLYNPRAISRNLYHISRALYNVFIILYIYAQSQSS